MISSGSAELMLSGAPVSSVRTQAFDLDYAGENTALELLVITPTG
jgi:hypothetical protein